MLTSIKKFRIGLTSAKKMKFRFDIGFLRAFAVIVVLLFHYKVPSFYGGFIGVDIFFVISGYLMTSIILSGFARNAFSIIAFYQRRINRIVPALLCMIIGTLLFAFFYYLPFDYMQISTYAASASIFMSNIYFAIKSGYFDVPSQFNPYLHTWSLSVEWQFYILYPMVLSAFKKIYLHSRKQFNYLFSILTIASFASIFVMSEFLANKNHVFYFIIPRAWEMMIGGYAYLFADRFKKIVTHAQRKWFVLASLGVLGSCTIFYDEGFAWPSYLTILPVLATAVIIISEIEFSLFKNRVLQFIGKVSYSLYLWHWPIYVFLLYRDYDTSPPIVVVGMLILAGVLAYLSYRFVEERVKNMRSIYIVVALLVAVSGMFLNSRQPVNYEYFPLKVSQIQFKADSIKKYAPKYGWNVQPKDDFNAFKSYLQVDTTRSNVVVIGDSHAGHFSTAILERVDTAKCKLLFEIKSGTLPLKDIDSTEFGPSRDKLAKQMMNYTLDEFLPKNKHHIHLLIISANFFGIVTRDPGHLNELLASVKKTTDYIASLGIPFVILGQTEVYNIPFPVVASLQLISERTDYTSAGAYNLNQELKKMYLDSQYFDIYNYASDKRQDVALDSVYMYDGHHFSYPAAEKIIKRMITEKRISFYENPG